MQEVDRHLQAQVRHRRNSKPGPSAWSDLGRTQCVLLWKPVKEQKMMKISAMVIQTQNRQRILQKNIKKSLGYVEKKKNRFCVKKGSFLGVHIFIINKHISVF